MRIELIGLGIKGRRRACNLFEDGDELSVHNRTREKAGMGKQDFAGG